MILSATDGQKLCDSFVAFFGSKIKKIKKTICSQLKGDSTDPLFADKLHNGELFRVLKPPSVAEVKKLIDTMPSKSSPMDRIPTSLVKN